MLKLLSTCAAFGLTAMAVAVSAQGQAPANPVELKVGDPAPAFALMGSDGKVHKLSDYKGKTVVLAWVPKAFTGGGNARGKLPPRRRGGNRCYIRPPLT